MHVGTYVSTHVCMWTHSVPRSFHSVVIFAIFIIFIFLSDRSRSTLTNCIFRAKLRSVQRDSKSVSHKIFFVLFFEAVDEHAVLDTKWDIEPQFSISIDRWFSYLKLACHRAVFEILQSGSQCPSLVSHFGICKQRDKWTRMELRLVQTYFRPTMPDFQIRLARIMRQLTIKLSFNLILP